MNEPMSDFNNELDKLDLEFNLERHRQLVDERDRALWTDNKELYTLEEWVQREAASYADYLRCMSGDALVEEYHRQGGEDVVGFNKRFNRIVVNAGDFCNGCPKCHSRLVCSSEYSPGGFRQTQIWCPECGFFYSELLRGGVGAGGEEQLSGEELLRLKTERKLRIERDGLHWRAITKRNDEGRD